MTVRPYYDQDGITIYHADCRDILAELPTVDIIYTSPPYNVGLRYPGFIDKLPIEDFWAFNAQWMGLLWECLADPGRAYIWVGDKMLPWFVNPPTPWQYTQLLAFCKPNFGGGTTRMAGDWANMVEWGVLYRKGKRTPMLNGEGNTHNYFVIPSPQSNWLEDPKEHPAQQPIHLAQRVISRTPGVVILDPFCGSGTTLVAAKNLGRQAIGVDVDEAACEIAAKRLSQSVMRLESKEKEQADGPMMAGMEE